MILSFPISAEAEAKLVAKARAAGVDVETFAARTIERVALRPTLHEALSPLRFSFEQSGMSEAELTELLESVKHDQRAARRAGEAP